MSDLLNVSVSGLRLSQAALRTTGHNIANAGTEGYSRQSVSAVTNPASFIGAGYVGNGVNLDSIDRIANDFVTQQLRIDSTLYKDLEAYQQQIRQMDNLLSDVSTGLTSAFKSFFTAMQNGADDPTSIPARQLIISESQNLSDRFNSIHERMRAINNGVSDGMEVAVSQVNALTSSVAQFNLKISNTGGLNGVPNDLFDQREEALRQLSELVSIQTFDQGNGHINVITGNGQGLVIGVNAREIDMVASAENAAYDDIIFKGESNNQPLTDEITGGELGGLIRIGDDVRTAFRELGRVAVSMAHSFNETHSMGVTLENEFGGDFFYDVNSESVARKRVVSNSNNQPPADRRLQLLIQDITQLTVSDYKMTIPEQGLYRIERQSDGVEVATGLFSGAFPFSAEFDGLELEFEGGTFQAGDSFLIQPTISGGLDFSRTIVNARDIAFGSPLLTDASIGNTGSGKITPGELRSLIDINGDDIPLLSTPGEMNPPLMVQFTSPTSYDVLDNSDPGKPVQLSPPIRDQRFIPGVNNKVFSEDPGETMVSTNGSMMGLPEGRLPTSQASLQIAGSVPPDFTVSDFSSAANQFSFDVVVSGTLSGTNDGTHTVVINNPGILDEDTLLQTINTQISTTPVLAYMTDAGSVGFRFLQPGYGDISVQNYDGDPDLGGGSAAVGLANNLLGFDIEGSAFTTVANADGLSGVGTLSNSYTSELITLTQRPEVAGLSPTVTNVFTDLHSSAKEIASQLSNVPGVEANAYTYLSLTDLRVTNDTPLQFNLNGEDLLGYQGDPVTGDPVLSDGVPNPSSQPVLFNNYLAEQINKNSNLSEAGIYAVAGQNADSGDAEIRVYSREGDDLTVAFRGSAGQTIAVNDGENPNVTLTGSGNGVDSSIVVGGKLDVRLGEGISLSTTPRDSRVFGDTTDSDFAKSTYYGIQVEINGGPETGDTFTLGFNADAALDNRNAIAFVNLENTKILANGNQTYSDSYGSLVENIGIKTNAAKINTDAAKEVLEQTNAVRNSISGVNLDDEAADLIRFEQFFAANAQVISVARDLFDRLISSF